MSNDQAPAAKSAVYVIQRQTQPGNDEGTICAEWEDAATVMVPWRSQRKTILRAAQSAGVEFPATVRILDRTAAEALSISFGEVGPPPLVIGA